MRAQQLYAEKNRQRQYLGHGVAVSALTPLMILVYTQRRNKIREVSYLIAQGHAKPTYEECMKLGVPERTIRRWVENKVVRDCQVTNDTTAAPT